MEQENKHTQKLDLPVLFDDFLKFCKRFFLAGVILAVLGAGFMGLRHYRGYYPIYSASASFTVKVANPLYASVYTYNTQTAEQMAKSFPYILTSGVLRERVMQQLSISYMPSVSVKASIGSSVLTMTVQDTDPQRAYDVLNAVITHYPEIAEFVVGPTILVLLDESGVPTAPSNSMDLPGAAVKGAVLGILLWAIGLLIMTLVRSTIHNEDELKKVLNTPCIGQIPAIRGIRRNICPIAHKIHTHSGFSESVRLLRMRTEKYMAQQNHKILLISSASPSEGKTTVSVNLGVSWARKGKRVLIIDCDLRNPSIAKALQVETDMCLADYLAGNVSVRNLIQPTEQENLFIISGNTSTANGTPILAQEQTRRLLQACRSLFDYVILDTPPCALLADASEIADMAECGLLVIRQDSASREQILDGIHRLDDAKLPLIGCVLNNVRKSISDGNGYGYGYNYGYGYGYGYGNYGEQESE